eukprot:14448996-Ditylum_brightwellii.AAC.1
MEKTSDGDGDKELAMEEQKLFEEACKEGIGVPYRIYIKLPRKEKKVLYEARQKKRGDTNGGLGLQYNLNQQLMNISPGFALTPMSKNNETLGSTGDYGENTGGTNDNMRRAANCLQLANGGVVVR